MKPATTESSVNNKTVTTNAVSVDEVHPALPNKALDANVLFQVLSANLASYTGDWVTAYEFLYDAANATQDLRLVRLSTLLAFNTKDYQKVLDAASLWVTVLPDDQQAKYSLLLGQVGVGQFDAAYIGLAELLKNNVDEGIKQVAGLLVRQTNGELAVSIMQQFVVDYPESVPVLISSAYVAQFFKNLDKAGQWVGKALVLQPDSDLAAQMQVNHLQQQGKTEQRSQFFKQFVEANPQATSMQLAYAGELSSQKQYSQALVIVQRVLEQEPENQSALIFAAALADHNNQTLLAKQYYQQVLVLTPNNDDARFSLARLAWVEEDYEYAEKLYKKISDSQHVFNARLQIANIRYHTQGIDAALQQLDRIEPQTNADYVEHVLTRHQLLYQANRYKDAFGYMNEAILNLPDYIDFLYARALVAAELGDLLVAENDLRAILTEQPNHANAMNALGYTLADQTDRLDEAKELIAAALALRPSDAHILDSMGWVLYRLKDFTQALDYLKQAYAVSPEAEIAAHLGEVLWESGQPKLAHQIWQEAVARDANNRVLNAVMRKYQVAK